MHILVTGGSGLIGRHFIRHFENEHQFTVLTRDKDKARTILGEQVKLIDSLLTMVNLDDFDAVLNLAGEPIVDKRWSASQKKVIEDSRIQTTKQLVALFTKSTNPPRMFLSGSAIGFYGRQDDQELTESFTQVYDEYSHRLCAHWEAVAQQASSKTTSVCILRTGIVLAKDGGALSKMLLPFKLGGGGPIASGNQYMSWIHIDDMVLAIQHLLTNDSSKGIYNFTAPQPESNRNFAKKLGSALGRPAILPMPEFALRLMMGESADLLVYGQRVIPQALCDQGFTFKYNNLEKALADIV
jgi:uncharacterized protein (TIGR01777 family)